MSVSTRREEGLGKETEREGEREGAKGNQDTQSEKSGKETPESEESGKETQCEAFEEKEKRDKPAEKVSSFCSDQKRRLFRRKMMQKKAPDKGLEPLTLRLKV